MSMCGGCIGGIWERDSVSAKGLMPFTRELCYDN